MMDWRRPTNIDSAANVSGKWLFKENNFIVEAYRDIGTEAVLWTLSIAARDSFHFLPSCLVWFEGHREEMHNDCETDLMVVVDGRTFAIELTTSATLKDDKIEKLAEYASRVRPDAFLVVCGAGSTRARSQIQSKLDGKLHYEIDVDDWKYEKDGVDFDPNLPYQNWFSFC